MRLRHNRVPTVRIKMALVAAFDELVAELGDKAVPEPLRLLAEIEGVPLYVSTTPDDLILRALRRTRPQAVSLAHTLTDGSGPSRETLTRQGPPVVQIFGALSADGGFALTEEDVLEYMCNIANRTALRGRARPAQEPPPAIHRDRLPGPADAPVHAYAAQQPVLGGLGTRLT